LSPVAVVVSVDVGPPGPAPPGPPALELPICEVVWLTPTEKSAA